MKHFLRSSIFLLFASGWLMMGLGQVSLQALPTDNSLRFAWSPASGAVRYYNVFLAVNDGTFHWFDRTTDATPVYVLENAQSGFTYRIKVQAVDAAGQTGPESDASDPILLQQLHLAEKWNLISFPIGRCYYEGTPPTVPMPAGTEYVDVSDLGYGSLKEWFSAHLIGNLPQASSTWSQVKGFDIGGAHVLDASLPAQFQTLKYMAGGYGYWVKMDPGSGGGTLTWKGPRLAEASVLTLNIGWNLVGYLPKTGYYDTATPPPQNLLYTSHVTWIQTPPSVIDQVFASIRDLFVYVSTASPGGAAYVFDPHVPATFATLHHLAPGNGYEIKMSQPASLIFNSPPVAALVSPSRPMSPEPPRFVTNRVAFIYGRATWDGQPARVGAPIEVRTQDGQLVARGRVRAEGWYGALAVYGDDLTTQDRDGALEGEWLRVFLNEQPSSEAFRWAENQLIPLDLNGRPRPSQTQLGQNFPNPFNPETWIPFALAEDAPVQVRIYDVAGRLVRTLDLGYRQAGWYDTKNRAAYWDGRNAAGERVASGLYFYQLVTPHHVSTKHLVIRK